jgi:hypothetical protein
MPACLIDSWPIMSDTIRPAGWGWPGDSRKAHYFEANDTRSLCSKWGFFEGQREDDNHGSPDNCTVCRRKREALATHKPG